MKWFDPSVLETGGLHLYELAPYVLGAIGALGALAALSLGEAMFLLRGCEQKRVDRGDPSLRHFFAMRYVVNPRGGQPILLEPEGKDGMA
jgi:hypothetical protein